jgi:hypothetical protein
MQMLAQPIQKSAGFVQPELDWEVDSRIGGDQLNSFRQRSKRDLTRTSEQYVSGFDSISTIGTNRVRNGALE